MVENTGNFVATSAAIETEAKGWAWAGRQSRSVRCGGVGAVRSASPSTAAARSVARVLPTVRSPADVNVAMISPVGPAYYAPTATLDLYPNMLVPVEVQGPAQYLYLSRRFLSYLRRGFVPNHIPLSAVTVTTHNDDFPPVPSLVFGPLTGSNMALFDQ